VVIREIPLVRLRLLGGGCAGAETGAKEEVSGLARGEGHVAATVGTVARGFEAGRAATGAVSIPLSTAENAFFAPKICPVTIQNLREISSLDVIPATGATAEIRGAGAGLATDRLRNSGTDFA
jgi:hypothetical protein